MSDEGGADSDTVRCIRYTQAMKFPVTYVRLLVRILKLGLSKQKLLLHGTSLTPDMLESLDQQVTQTDYIRVIGNLLEEIDEPHLGLYVGSRMPIAAHGSLGQLLSSSPDLYTAWDELSRYQLLRLPLLKVNCSANQDFYTFELELTEGKGATCVFLLDTLMVTIQRGIELIIGKRLHESTVELMRPMPESIAEFSRYVPGKLIFDATRNCIRVPLELMKRPNPYNDPVVWELTLTLCEQLKLQSNHQSAVDISFAEQIRQLIGQQSGKLWSLDEIAIYFHISPRTVIRRLKMEGTQYQKILNAELEKQAKLYLSEPDHTVESAALSLGYQDTSAFRRAFRRWCGVSPSEWRAATPTNKLGEAYTENRAGRR